MTNHKLRSWQINSIDSVLDAGDDNVQVVKVWYGLVVRSREEVIKNREGSRRCLQRLINLNAIINGEFNVTPD